MGMSVWEQCTIYRIYKLILCLKRIPQAKDSEGRLESVKVGIHQGLKAGINEYIDDYKD